MDQLLEVYVERCSDLNIEPTSKILEVCRGYVGRGVKPPHLSLSGLVESGSDIRALVDAVSAVGFIHSLSLTGVHLDHSLLQALCASLWNNDTLEHLSLSGSSCGDEGVDPLVQLLSRNTSLQVLDLDDCALTDVAISSLVTALAVNTHLTSLNLSGNSQITDKAAQSLVELLEERSTAPPIDFNLDGSSVSDELQGKLQELVLLHQVTRKTHASSATSGGAAATAATVATATVQRTSNNNGSSTGSSLPNTPTVAAPFRSQHRSATDLTGSTDSVPSTPTHVESGSRELKNSIHVLNDAVDILQRRLQEQTQEVTVLSDTLEKHRSDHEAAMDVLREHHKAKLSDNKRRWDEERGQLHYQLTAEQDQSRRERHLLQQRLHQLWQDKALLDNQVLALEADLRKKDRVLQPNASNASTASNGDNSNNSSSNQSNRTSTRKASGPYRLTKGSPYRADDMHFVEMLPSEIPQYLLRRYQHSQPFCGAGRLMLMMKPDRELRDQLYRRRLARMFADRRHPVYRLPAHLYRTGRDVLESLSRTGQSQCVMFMGESGAGKTRAAAEFVQFILESGFVSVSNAQLPDVYARCMTVLQAFGHAQTLFNANASRYTKSVQILLARADPFHEFEVAGIQVRAHNLLTTRLTHVGDGQRTFHVLYWMLAGLPNSFPSLAKSFHEYYMQFNYAPGGIDFDQDAMMFEDLLNALEELAFEHEEVESLFAGLIAIMILGDLQFIEKREEPSSSATSAVSGNAAAAAAASTTTAATATAATATAATATASTTTAATAPTAATGTATATTATSATASSASVIPSTATPSTHTTAGSSSNTDSTTTPTKPIATEGLQFGVQQEELLKQCHLLLFPFDEMVADSEHTTEHDSHSTSSLEALTLALCSHSSIRECERARDVMCQSLYSRLFQWLVLRLNRTINSCIHSTLVDCTTASLFVVDPSGLEPNQVDQSDLQHLLQVGGHSVLEQLLVNYTSEVFLNHVFSELIISEKNQLAHDLDIKKVLQLFEGITPHTNELTLKVLHSRVAQDVGLIEAISRAVFNNTPADIFADEMRGLFAQKEGGTVNDDDTDVIITHSWGTGHYSIRELLKDATHETMYSHLNGLYEHFGLRMQPVFQEAGALPPSISLTAAIQRSLDELMELIHVPSSNFHVCYCLRLDAPVLDPPASSEDDQPDREDQQELEEGDPRSHASTRTDTAPSTNTVPDTARYLEKQLSVLHLHELLHFGRNSYPDHIRYVDLVTNFRVITGEHPTFPLPETREQLMQKAMAILGAAQLNEKSLIHGKMSVHMRIGSLHYLNALNSAQLKVFFASDVEQFTRTTVMKERVRITHVMLETYFFRESPAPLPLPNAVLDACIARAHRHPRDPPETLFDNCLSAFLAMKTNWWAMAELPDAPWGGWYRKAIQVMHEEATSRGHTTSDSVASPRADENSDVTNSSTSSSTATESTSQSLYTTQTV